MVRGGGPLHCWRNCAEAPRPDTEKAQACLERALAVAREQQAKAWELRAAMSMARLWRDQDKRQQARDLLAPVYNWLTEGFINCWRIERGISKTFRDVPRHCWIRVSGCGIGRLQDCKSPFSPCWLALNHRRRRCRSWWSALPGRIFATL